MQLTNKEKATLYDNLRYQKKLRDLHQQNKPHSGGECPLCKLEAKGITREINSPKCKVCDQSIPESNYELLEKAQDYGVVHYVICNWCIQLVKELE